MMGWVKIKTPQGTTDFSIWLHAMVTINHLIVPAARALRRTGTSLYTHAYGIFRVYFGFL